jgi:hypothetical protein
MKFAEEAISIEMRKTLALREEGTEKDIVEAFFKEMSLDLTVGTEENYCNLGHYLPSQLRVEPDKLSLCYNSALDTSDLKSSYCISNGRTHYMFRPLRAILM